MKFLEKDLEEILMETRNEDLRERGLHVCGKKFRQLRIGKYGIADMVIISRPCFVPGRTIGGGWFDEPLTITIYELKKDTISMSTFLQAVRYAKGVKSYLKKKRPNNDYIIKICLIGREVNLNSDFVYITDLFEDVSMFTYKYCIDGLNFDEKNGYKLIEEGFDGNI